MNLAGVEEIIRLRRTLDNLQENMENRIGNLQGKLQDRMRNYQRQISPSDDDQAEDS